LKESTQALSWKQLRCRVIRIRGKFDFFEKYRGKFWFWANGKKGFLFIISNKKKSLRKRIAARYWAPVLTLIKKLSLKMKKKKKKGGLKKL